MHITLSYPARARQYLLLASILVASTAAPAFAENAYIAQVTGRPGIMTARTTPTPAPLVVPSTQYGPGQASFIPTPGIAVPIHGGNFAQTLQIGNFNQVAQFQSGQNNFSNVGILGGRKNNVGVWQGGRDLSNLYLVNTQGLSVGVLQPPGAAPVNMLIARLPNGGLLIKR